MQNTRKLLSSSESTPATSPTANDIDDDKNMDVDFSHRGCCFWLPCFTSSRPSASPVGPSWWQPISKTDSPIPISTPSTVVVDVDHWWTRGWKKAREFSEIVAGPRWKTFIRRFNTKSHRAGGVGVGGGRKFQYDPLSYALNFDEGPRVYSPSYDDDAISRGFSTRYASLPSSAKSSMDLGKDAPSFT